MPDITINGARLRYEIQGEGQQTLLFIHGLLMDGDSWERQISHFAASHRVVTFDLRGQGRSEHTRERLDLDSLAEDTIELIRALGPGPCHVVGFSMGAFIALRVAARRPELAKSLFLIGASADAEEPANGPRYALMIAVVSAFGPRPLAGRLMRILFGDTFLADPERRSERLLWKKNLAALPRSTARAARASAARRSVWPELARISAPTLVLSGTEDRPVKPARSRALAGAIAGAVFVPVPETGHAVMIERPELGNATLENWLANF